MAEECTHDCSTCSANCSSRQPESLLAAPHEKSHIGKVIGVVSGKGGVGKSMVTSLLAVMLARKGLRTAVLDADITGPSIPKVFGVKGDVTGDETGINPLISSCGTKIMSVNLLLDNETTPVIWRGPVIAGTVKQFWTDVMWGDVDVMLVDCPPGTGDVPLTVFQSIPLSGVVIVTSPQELVSMIVGKAANMAKMMNIPVLGVVENMSYVACPDCGKQIEVFGPSRLAAVCEEYGFAPLGRMPLDPTLASLCDAGSIELAQSEEMAKAADQVASALGL